MPYLLNHPVAFSSTLGSTLVSLFDAILFLLYPHGGSNYLCYLLPGDRCPLKRIFPRNCIGGIPPAKIKGYFLIILYNRM